MRKRSTAGEEKWKQTMWPSTRLILIILMWSIRNGDAVLRSGIKRKGMPVPKDRDPCCSDDDGMSGGTAPIRFQLRSTNVRKAITNPGGFWHGAGGIARCILKFITCSCRRPY